MRRVNTGQLDSSGSRMILLQPQGAVQAWLSREGVEPEWGGDWPGPTEPGCGGLGVGVAGGAEIPAGLHPCVQSPVAS